VRHQICDYLPALFAFIFSLLLVSEKGAGVTFSSCFTQPSFNNESPLLFKLSYVAIILFDTFIFVLAAARTGWMYRAKQLRRSHSSIVSILLRDGTMLYA